MKKYSWILALLLALAMVFIGCPGSSKDDDDDDNTDPTDVVEADDIDVEFGEGKIEVLVTGDGAKVEYVEGGYKLTYGTAGHGNTRAYFKVNLGTASIKSFEKATFDFTAGGGDVLLSSNNDGPKTLNLLATNSQDEMKKYLADSEIMSLTVNSVKSGSAGGALINQGGVPVAPDGEKEIAIEAGRPKASLSGEVWFSIYLHAEPDGTKGSPTPNNEKTSFTIQNFKLVALVGEAKDTVVTIDEIKGVTVPVQGKIAPAKITDTDQYTGTIAWTPAVDAEAGFELDEVYTATITLTVKEGYTFAGLAADFFKVAGADSVAFDAATSKITAVFPAAPAPPPGVIFKIDGVDQEAEVTAVGGEYELLLDGSGFTYTFGEGQYGSAYAYFQVNFGAGKTIYDYPKVSFTFKGEAGDIAYKSVAVFVSDEELGGDLLEADAIGTRNFPATNTAATPGTVYFIGGSADTGRTPFVSIMIRAAKVGGNPEATTSYTISDISFDAVTRHTVTLDPDGGSVSPTSITVIEGAIVGALPTPIYAGKDCIGWYDASNNLVDSNTVVTAAFNAATLTAQWINHATIAPIEVDLSSVVMASAGGPAVTASTATSYTFTTNNYSGLVKFTIDLGSNVLANIDRVTFTIQGSGSDYNYKNVYLIAGAALVNGDSGESSAKAVSSRLDSGSITSAVERSFVINKSKTATLTGTLEMAIYIHAPAGQIYTISDVVLSQD